LDPAPPTSHAAVLEPRAREIVASDDLRDGGLIGTALRIGVRIGLRIGLPVAGGARVRAGARRARVGVRPARARLGESVARAGAFRRVAGASRTPKRDSRAPATQSSVAKTCAVHVQGPGRTAKAGERPIRTD